MALLVALFVAGCGGGGGGSTTVGAQGQVAYQWTWRTISRGLSSRVIPTASNSMVLSLKNGSGSVVASGTVAFPVSSWLSPSVPVGTYTLTSSTYPTTNGSGVAQAKGSTSVAVTANQTATADLTLGSTVAAMTVSAQSSTVNGGSQIQLTATAMDSGGNTVVVDPSAITWSTNNTAVANVSATGLVTTFEPGSVGLGATFNQVDLSLGQTPVVSPLFPLTVAGGSTTVTIH